MTEVCKTLNPQVCLEAIGGAVTAEIMGFMGINSTIIAYGCLSEQDVDGISLLTMLQKN